MPRSELARARDRDRHHRRYWACDCALGSTIDHHRAGWRRPGSYPSRAMPNRTCVRCSAPFVVAFNAKWRHCEPCREVIRYRPDPAAVRYATCVFCREPMTLHGTQQLCKRVACRRRGHAIKMRDYMREYQRRTRYTAISYWAVAPTPEAKALARTYYELRQELRTRRTSHHG